VIADLKPYAEHRDSGLPWLGPMPAHWEIARSKRLFVERKQYAAPDDIQLSATQAYGVIPQAEYEARSGYRVVKISMHLDKRRRVEKDDFVISMRSFEGGLERAWASGAIRSSYVVLKPTTAVHAGYFRYFFKSVPYITALRATANFIRDGQDLNFGNFAAVPLPLVPLEEQAAIARFLNWANDRLERAIRAKRKVIALLNEQRQTIVHRAVTRGLDPAVALRPSGVDWLGDIPRHWEVKRIKYLLREVDERSTTGAEDLLSMRMHHGLVLFAEHFSRPPQAASLAGFKLVRPGQFVVNRMQAGNGVIFASSLNGLVSPDYAVFDPVGDANVEFLGELFRSRKVRAKFRAESKGLGTGTSGFLRLYNDRLGAIHVALPPKDEQTEIVRSMTSELGHVDAAISKLEREITLLREYGHRLVADAVTGQVDTCDAADRLPDSQPDDRVNTGEEPGLEDMTADEEAPA